jgi:hypothetical protein
MTPIVLLLMALGLSMSASSFGQNTLLVSADKNICPNATLASIQQAIDHAVAGDTIDICPGTYHEQVFI